MIQTLEPNKIQTLEPDDKLVWNVRRVDRRFYTYELRVGTRGIVGWTTTRAQVQAEIDRFLTGAS